MEPNVEPNRIATAMQSSSVQSISKQLFPYSFLLKEIQDKPDEVWESLRVRYRDCLYFLDFPNDLEECGLSSTNDATNALFTWYHSKLYEHANLKILKAVGKAYHQVVGKKPQPVGPVYEDLVEELLEKKFLKMHVAQLEDAGGKTLDAEFPSFKEDYFLPFLEDFTRLYVISRRKKVSEASKDLFIMDGANIFSMNRDVIKVLVDKIGDLNLVTSTEQTWVDQYM